MYKKIDAKKPIQSSSVWILLIYYKSSEEPNNLMEVHLHYLNKNIKTFITINNYTQHDKEQFKLKQE